MCAQHTYNPRMNGAEGRGPPFKAVLIDILISAQLGLHSKILTQENKRKEKENAKLYENLFLKQMHILEKVICGIRIISDFTFCFPLLTRFLITSKNYINNPCPVCI